MLCWAVNDVIAHQQVVKPKPGAIGGIVLSYSLAYWDETHLGRSCSLIRGSGRMRLDSGGSRSDMDSREPSCMSHAPLFSWMLTGIKAIFWTAECLWATDLHLVPTIMCYTRVYVVHPINIRIHSASNLSLSLKHHLVWIPDGPTKKPVGRHGVTLLTLLWITHNK